MIGRARLKPPAVAKGARIALVAPASAASMERIEAGIRAIQALGFEVVTGPHARGSASPYFSGTAGERLDDLHWAFTDPEIAAVICIRGGYGSNYLLDQLDLELIRTHPKPLFAYSDMTALQLWLLDRIGLPAFHGPMAASDFYLEEGVDWRSFHAAISGGLVSAGSEEGLRVLRPGRARGVLYGGCLSLLTASLGTRHAAHTEGKLLFLEDVAAKPYQVDRMLRQLILAGKLEGVSGIVFGEMLDCVSPGAPPELLETAILRVLEDFTGPIAIGLLSGHVSRRNVTLTFGLEAELNLEGEPRLELLEPAVRVS